MSNGVAVHCYSAAQAMKLKQINTLGQWSVQAAYPKSETHSKGVTGGMLKEVSDYEILDLCKSQEVVGVRRLIRRVDGKFEES